MSDSKKRDGFPSENRFGENLKSLRKAYGETLESLGESLGFHPSTLSGYESGARKPDMQKLEIFSKYFGKTVDELLNEDLTNIDNINTNYSIKETEKFKSMIMTMFPLACSEKALENLNFKKGYKLCEEIIEAFAVGRQLGGTIIHWAFDAFRLSIEEDEIIESAVNILWLYFILWTQIIDDQFIKEWGRSYFSDSFRKAYILHTRVNTNVEIENKRKEFINDCNECIVELIKEIKESIDWYEIADYYLALRYVVSMVDSGLSPEMNQTIGIHMMLSFVELDNRFALEFISM